jgi:HPt (histidine-containing phosphotransfer) domain-containing protein
VREAPEAKRLFLDAQEAQQGNLSRAAAEVNVGDVEATAHRLRALSGSIRAEETNQVAAKLERLAKGGLTPECWAQVEQVILSRVGLKRVLADTNPSG